MIKKLLLAGLICFGLSAYHGQNFIATYGFADVTTSTGTLDPSPSPTLSGLSFGAFSAQGPFLNPSASGRFSFTGWPQGGVNGTDDYSLFTGALSPTVYFEVTVSAAAGYTLDLSTIAFTVRRSGTGIRHYCVRSGLDNYINNLAISTGTNPKLSALPGEVFYWNFDSVSASVDQKGSTVHLGNNFKNLSGSVSFRFYAWNAESSGGSFAIDNVAFTGALRSPDLVGTGPMVIQDHRPKLFPNPCTQGTVIFLQSHGTAIKDPEVYTAAGEKVEVRQSKRTEEETELDLSELPAGLYFVKSSQSGADVLSRIVLLRW